MIQRTVIISAFSALLALSAACGGDDDGPANNDAAANVDADPSAPDATAAVPDADPAAPDAHPGVTPDAGLGVTCGASTCDPPDQVCCVTQQSQICQAPGDCNGGADVSCDGPEDCGDGEVCCGSGGGGGGMVSCTSGQCEFVVCHEAADCPNASDMCCDFGFGSSVCSSFCI